VADERSLRTADGLVLEAQLALPAAPGATIAGVLLCHPHPLHGGTMRSIVIGALFDALPQAGIACLRFNFRGVEGSDGRHEDGVGELVDVTTGLAALRAELDPGSPVVLAGWSFGADMVLATTDAAVVGRVAIAPPLRYATAYAAAFLSTPKLLVLAQHDEFRAPAEVVAATEDWTATEVDVVPGASHFFVGRTDRVVEATRSFVARVVGATR